MTQVDDIGIEELTRGSKLGDRKFVSVTRDILHLAQNSKKKCLKNLQKGKGTPPCTRSNQTRNRYISQVDAYKVDKNKFDISMTKEVCVSRDVYWSSRCLMEGRRKLTQSVSQKLPGGMQTLENFGMKRQNSSVLYWRTRCFIKSRIRGFPKDVT